MRRLIQLSGVMIGSVGTMLFLFVIAACTNQSATALNNAVAAGQLFCAKATATGPLTVKLATDAGAPVTVTNKGAAVVSDACAVIGAIPVAPPPDPAAAPTVAAPVAPAAAKPTS